MFHCIGGHGSCDACIYLDDYIIKFDTVANSNNNEVVVRGNNSGCFGSALRTFRLHAGGILKVRVFEFTRGGESKTHTMAVRERLLQLSLRNNWPGYEW